MNAKKPIEEINNRYKILEYWTENNKSSQDLCENIYF